MDGADFLLTPLAAGVRAQPNNILTGVDTPEAFTAAVSGAWMYFNGNISMLPDPAAGNKRINPDHGLIVELMGAIRREAEPKAIETLFRRDVTLSFKLLRYINSPGFGLNTRVESVRHALSIIGYQQLLKWLTLLAATAGQGAAPALTHTAMVRARLLELMGAKLLEKNDADNLFMAGMLSLLDRIMGAPLADILAHVNLPQPIAEALIHDSGKYRRFLQLAHACEGKLPPEDVPWADLDAKVVNVAHLEAVEWATQVMKTASEP
jgi:EAL and modified HD-GYP domain-containing signal transduction protein